MNAPRREKLIHPFSPGSSHQALRPNPPAMDSPEDAAPGVLIVPSPPSLLDHLIRSLQQRRRDRQAEGFGGLEVDNKLELGRLLHGEVRGLGALEDLVDVAGG